MNLYQWLCLLGIPTLTALMTGALFGTMKDRARKNEREAAAIRLGVQALLRSQLYESFGECLQKGFASVQDRENFENMYQQYEKLGKNGVMENIRTRFFSLPAGEGGNRE